MPNKLIIGCGYLGRRVADVWLRRGETVFALTRSQERAREFRHSGIEPIIGDVTRPESLAGLPEVGTTLYAVGFDRSAGPSMREVYVDGLTNVLDHIATRTGRFLYVSSTSVYGQTDGEWVDEDSPCEPTRENGVICREAEERVRSLSSPESREIPGNCTWNILRLAGIYGPGRMLRRIEAVTSGEPVTGNPEAFLNLIHVDDAVQAVLACEEKGKPGRAYLISDDHPLTRREYYATLARLLNAPPPGFVDNADSGSSRTPGLNKRCDNRRMKHELQVTLRYPTAEAGLRDALQQDDGHES